MPPPPLFDGVAWPPGVVGDVVLDVTVSGMDVDSLAGLLFGHGSPFAVRGTSFPARAFCAED
jgi:hypothetical protein